MFEVTQRNRFLRKAFQYSREGNYTMMQFAFSTAKQHYPITRRQTLALQQLNLQRVGAVMKLKYSGGSNVQGIY